MENDDRSQKYIRNKIKSWILIITPMGLIIFFGLISLIAFLKNDYSIAIFLLAIGIILIVLLNYLAHKEYPEGAILSNDKMTIQYRGLNLDKDIVIPFRDVADIQKDRNLQAYVFQMKDKRKIVIQHIDEEIINNVQINLNHQ